MADIFLSYAREDELRARAVAVELESCGWSVFWDRRIPHGQDFTTHLQQQLDEARCIVVLWSQASVASRFVRDEASEGLDGRLVPVFIEATRQPLGFRQLQAAELGNWQGARPHVEFDRLVDSIAAIVPLPTLPLVGTSEAITDAIPWVGGSYDADVYISAVESDDVAISADSPGWVTHLRRALTARLAQLLGGKPVVRNAQLKNAVTLRNRGRRPAVFVAVASPGYVSSETARQELADCRARIFKVLKTPVRVAQQPQELQSLLGYEFFATEPDTGNTREFDAAFGPESEKRFWLRLDDMVHDIARALRELRHEPTDTPGQT
jgi:hypothetical protein